MSRARQSTRPPAIDPVVVGSLLPGDPRELRRSAELEAVRFSGLNTGALDLAAATLTECRLAQVTATETDLQGARLREVEFDRVELPVVRAARSQWRNVQVTGRLGSLEAHEAQWRGVHFVDCKLNYVNLRGAELLDVAFTDCTVDDLDLLDADLRRVRFSGTRVTNLDVETATLRDVDLREATLENVAGPTSLRGATISPMQLSLLAPLLAEALGIRVD